MGIDVEVKDEKSKKSSYGTLSDFKIKDRSTENKTSTKKIQLNRVPPKYKKSKSQKNKLNLFIKNYFLGFVIFCAVIGFGVKMYQDHQFNKRRIQRTIEERNSKLTKQDTFIAAEKNQNNLNKEQLKTEKFDPNTLGKKASCANEFPIKLCSLFGISKIVGYGFFIEENKLYLHSDFSRYHQKNKKYFDSKIKIKAFMISKLNLKFMRILKSMQVNSIHFFLTKEYFNELAIKKEISVDLTRFHDLFSSIYDLDQDGKEKSDSISFSDKESFLKAKNEQSKNKGSNKSPFPTKKYYKTLLKVIKVKP